MLPLKYHSVRPAEIQLSDQDLLKANQINRTVVIWRYQFHIFIGLPSNLNFSSLGLRTALKVAANDVRVGQIILYLLPL